MKKFGTYIVFLFSISVSAQVPELINYQGRLSDGNGLYQGDASFVFRLYDAVSGGNMLYEDSNTVTVTDGLYQTFIGDDTVSGSLSNAITNLSVYLELEVDGTVLSPRERLVSGAYSLRARAIDDGAALAEIADDDGAGSGLDADLLDGFHASAFATGTPLYVYAESDPVWTTASNSYYQKTEADTIFATGTPLYVESDPVWVNDSTGYFTKVQSEANFVNEGQGDSISTAMLTNDAVTSAKLADGTIVNLDVSSSAAIAFSKLNIVKDDIVGLGIPGEDTDTTYSAGYGLSLADTTFSVDPNAVVTTNTFPYNITANAFIGGGYFLTDVNADLLDGFDSTSFATGTPLYVFAESDPVWTTASNSYYQKTEADTIFATGTPLYVESDPVWVNDSTGYFTKVQSEANFVNEGQSDSISTAMLTNDAVTSAKLADGTIVNLDVSSSAAIAFSKLNIVKDDIVGLGIPGEDTDTTYTAGYGLSLADTTFSVDPNAVVTTNLFSHTIIANAFMGNGSLLTDVNADLLDGQDSTEFWHVSGNGGTTAETHFLGTTDDQPLEFKVNSNRVLRLEPSATSPNIVGGHASNTAGAAAGVFIGGGGGASGANAAAADFSSIVGGYKNTIEALSSNAIIGAGSGNIISSNAVNSVIVGGLSNTIRGVSSGNNAHYSFIGGGSHNVISNSDYAVIAGGSFNAHLGSSYATISGGNDNSIAATASFATIGGGEDNNIESSGSATIGGGSDNTIGDAAFDAVIAGGQGNAIQNNAAKSSIGGGEDNTVKTNATYCHIGGGGDNIVHRNNDYSTIAGGRANEIFTNADHAVVGGGSFNVIQPFATNAALAGGFGNLIGTGAAYATIPGGFSNAAASYSFASGRRAKATNDGSFVWADSTDADIGTTNNNQFVVRASGGTYIYSDSALTAGVVLYPGDATWTSVSDKNAKRDIEVVDAKDVLQRLQQIPVATWKYKTENSPRHMGPMAQDFYAAFNVGPTDRGIASVDADGVALAAIQGLYQLLQEKDAELKEMQLRLNELENKFKPSPLSSP